MTLLTGTEYRQKVSLLEIEPLQVKRFEYGCDINHFVADSRLVSLHVWWQVT